MHRPCQIVWLLLALLMAWEKTARPQTPLEAKVEPARFAIALAQPQESKTIAWLNNAPLWEGESFQGYGFGEWTWAPGQLTLLIKNPAREDLSFKSQIAGGDCYLLGIDSAQNPDPKKAEKFPQVTTATCVNIKAPNPGKGVLVYGVSFIRDPITLEVNGKKLTLKYGEPCQFSTGLAMIMENGQILTSSDPQDPCVIALGFFRNSEGKTYVINSRFY